MGDFNGWSREDHPLLRHAPHHVGFLQSLRIITSGGEGGGGGEEVGSLVFEKSLFEMNEEKEEEEEGGVWFIFLEDNADGTWAIKHR